MERIDPKMREDWERSLYDPLPGQEKKKPTEAMIEQEGADFMAAMAQHQSRKG